MKEEQERGRITAIRNRRRKAVEHAIGIAPLFEQARKELGSDPTLRAYADWLNERDYKTRKGKVWRAQSVSDALSVGDLVVRQAEREYMLTVAVEEEIFRRARNLGFNLSAAKERYDDAMTEASKSLAVSRDEATRLLALMRGSTYAQNRYEGGQ